MSSFDYVAIDVAGRERRGTVDAATPEAARDGLTGKRLYVVSVEPAAGPAPSGSTLVAAINRIRGRLTAKQLTLFTRQLATLSQVTPLEESLRTIARQTERANVAAVVERVHGGVFEGRRLADALAREPRSFPPLYRAMVAAGEGAGTLPVILERLADLQERQAAVRGRVIAALAYPIVLAIFACFVVAALMVFVIPKVVEQFDTVGQQLPLLTRIVIALSTFLANWWWLLAILAAIGLAAFGYALRQPAFRLRFDTWLLRLPFFGRMIRDLHGARMARTLSTMVASRLPLLEGLTLTTQTVHNCALRAASEDVVEAIRAGGSLSAALKRAGVFPPLLIYLAASGEASGQLDTMLARAADYLEREFDGFTATVLALLEPAIIIGMGALVTLIVLSILLPILQLESLAAL
jgi:general secretion pathway protein F